MLHYIGIHIKKDSPVSQDLVIVKPHRKVVGEFLAQVGVAYADIQRVGILSDRL
jgi:hypothetical protein